MAEGIPFALPVKKKKRRSAPCASAASLRSQRLPSRRKCQAATTVIRTLKPTGVVKLRSMVFVPLETSRAVLWPIT